MNTNKIWVINPPNDYLEVVWGIKLGEEPAKCFDWVTDELTPETEQLVQIFDHMEQDGE